MSFGLGYYGASNETSAELDYDGHPPKMSETLHFSASTVKTKVSSSVLGFPVSESS